MKTPQSKQQCGRQGSPCQWRWIALLAVLACLLVGRASAGTLTLIDQPLTNLTDVNLSAEGDLDWAHWGNFTTADYDHKAGVASQIPTYTPIGGGSYGSYGDDLARCSWIDGTIDQTATGLRSGLWASGPPVNAGYQLNIPASTTPRILHLYVGSWESTGQLELSLSDSSAASITNVVIRGDRWHRFTVTFAANSASQTLTINYYAINPGLSYGNVTLVAASLSSASPLPLSVAQPTLSSAGPLNAGSTFTVKANPTGVAANGATAFAYQWQVNNGGGYVDIAGGTSNPLQATAGSAGSYNYRVVVTNSVLGGPAVTSAPVALTVTTPTSTLGGGGYSLPLPVFPSTTPFDVDLTAEGTTDWGHWGIVSPTDYDYKNGTIGNFTQIGSDAPVPFASSASFSWTDATTANNPVAGTTSGVGLPVGNGFELNIPATTTDQIAYLYVGLNNARLNVTATLNDNSSPLFTDNPVATQGTLRYAIAFKSATSGKTLKVRLTETARTANNGSISLLSASLAPLPALSVGTLIADPGTAVLVNQPMVISLPPLDPKGAPPFSYVWQRDTGSGYVNLPDTGRSAVFAAGSTPGTESCRLIITGSQGSVTSAPVVLTRTAATGNLKLLAVETTVSSVNLTQEGSLDWSHWGFSSATDFDQKATGGSLIGDKILIGPSSSLARYGSGVSYRWYDGTPNVVATNSGAVYRYPGGNGFELQVAAATTNRLLHVYFGSYQAALHVQAYLSDNSAIKLVDETFPYNAGGSAAAKYNIQFAAGSPGQHLVFRVWYDTGGNVTLGAASLEGMPPLAAGTPSIIPTNVVPAGSSIALEASGASGVPVLSYQWQVDSGSGYTNLPGATSAHVATSAGTTVGGKNYRVVVSDVSGSVTSAPVTLTVTTPTSALAGNRITSTSLHFDLTAEGPLDWVHWGSGGIVAQKASLPGLISPYSIVGSGSILSYGGAVYYNWTDGTPEATGTDDTRGIYINGAGNGFALDVPATTTERVFTVYCGVYQATMHMEATMSDNSAPIYVDETLFNPGGTTDARYSFRYSSPNPGAVLQVRYWDLTGANVTLQSASLRNYVPVTPGNVQVQAVGGGQVQVTWTAGTLQEAPTVNGPWTANGATSPYTFTPTGAQKYFRTAQSPF